jgi:hypothetical protein
MKILIGYSRCSVTRSAFEALGHEAWTCDLLPPREGDTGRHLQCDVWDVAGDQWDMGIFHPMCTYLTVSAAWAFKDADFNRYPLHGYHQKPAESTLTGASRRAARDEAIDNFRRLMALPYPKACENPAISFLNTAYRPPDQIIHPYEFGDDASKATGLWLDRLPKLTIDPARRISGRIVDGKERWSNQTDSGQNNLGPSSDRWLERSATYAGIAKAFAEAWGRVPEYDL